MPTRSFLGRQVRQRTVAVNTERSGASISLRLRFKRKLLHIARVSILLIYATDMLTFTYSITSQVFVYSDHASTVYTVHYCRGMLTPSYRPCPEVDLGANDSDGALQYTPNLHYSTPQI